MAVVKSGNAGTLYREDYLGHAVETESFIATFKACAPGSTYMELDGAQRYYKFDGATWYEL